MSDSGRILVWFSCGAASAVAAKVAVERYGRERPVEVCNIDMSADEHPDNARFLADVERWIGVPIKRLRNEKYTGIHDVFLTERFIAGVTGAACTKRLKRHVQLAYQKPGDTLVVGFTADERGRALKLAARFPDEHFLWLLISAGVTKADCYRVLTSHGIELPAMYRLGFNNNNCIGCVKGGKGYWNKIRIHFPERFWLMARTEREVGFPVLRDVYLDELAPDDGRDVPEPDIECGIFCDQYTKLVELTAGGAS